MPHLVKLYIRQVLIGYAISAAFVAMLMVFNVANLWHLVSGSSIGWLAVLMLWVFNGIVFAGVQFALSLPKGHGDDTGRGRRDPVHVPLAEPVPVRVRARG
ncbi:hypothetical protein DKT77_00285 [Meridianimarinicoccus roseus]|jgi:hypothetical protein|uniref:Uncharacterized protein n=1 Tax=Meridianimarinicoccus roseus TaxID=2072018 RepID=A0A2V2LKL8_9RHOB|nr:hypothetical protein [Meridianimarinicoccus roseus]PWR04681.1 hypothetical protein DKT77_00285 [Meridianimarinicoccus roseus]